MDLQELTVLCDFTGRTVVVTGGAGVLGGEMACAQVALQSEAEAKASARERIERTIQLTTRLLLELRDNDARVARLRTALASSTTSRQDLWD